MRITAPFFILLLTAAAYAQEQRTAPPPPDSSPQNSPALLQRATTTQTDNQRPPTISLPLGTKVLLVLKNAVSSKNAKVGDGVFFETTFPVTANNQVVIPAGTYVQGSVASVQRSGRVKGRAEIQLRFTTLIYSNGYTVNLAGNLDSADSSDSQRVKPDGEGTIQADSTKGKDAATIATAAGAGTLIGGLSNGLKGAGIGGLAGAGVGVLTTMLTRGNEVRMEGGSTVEMVLQRPLDLEFDRITTAYDGNRPPTPQRWRTVQQSNSQSTVPGVPIPGIPK